VTHVQESDPVNGTYDVRFIASVSAEDWAGGNAGFEFDVSFDGEGTANDFENKTLTWYVSHGYKGINGKNQNGVVLEAVTATAGKYLIACTVKNVNAVGTVTFKVNAFVADAQGNRVDSEGYTVVYRNGSFVSGTKTNATVNYNLNGLPLSEYQIVYDADDAHAKTLAETLSTNLYARTGTRLAVVADTAAAGEHEIIVGETARNTSAYRGTTPIDTYAISSDGTHVVLTADYTKGLIEATEVFALRFASMARNVTVGSKEIHTCQKLSTMSFNVLYQDTSLSLAEDQATRWPAVVKMILNYMPDTVGMQETTTYWLEYLQADTEFTKYYTILEFKQRLTTGGKGATRELICFRKDRFTATETATKWLSETPDVENSYFTDASDPKHRILNYVKLKDKVTGEEIIHANTHLEHIKADVNLKQANVVLNILQQFEGYKVLLTGDFNANTSSNTYQTITGTDMWADSRSLADYTEGNGFTIPSANPTTTLDYCFVTDETISVNYHTVCNEKIVTDAYNGYASDHHPIFTVYGIKDMEITQQTMTLTSSNALIKTLGVRNLGSDTQLNCDWSCSGLEFVINNQSSEITFHLGADNPCYFRAYVDGEAYKTADGSEHLEIKTGSEMLTLTGLPTGVHTIRLIKVTGYTLSRAQIYSMSFCGSLLTPPADNELFIEYVGDSISCGYGVLSENTNDGKYTAQDGSLGYPYRLAEALGADYTITALSGQGLLCGDPGVPKGYQYACPKKDSTNPYTFARKADLVIINIGTNDYYLSAGGGTPHLDITEADFQAAYEAFIAQVKAANGSDCKILCLYGMMNDTYEDGILAAVKASGGEQSGIYTLKMAKSTSGHPWATDHAAYTETLTAYVTNTILK